MTAPQLSDRELHVLQRAAKGEIYDRIAADWGVTGRTVKQIASKMFAKLGARSMPHAVFLACRSGLLDGRPQRHGDHAGFAAHRYRGEEPCDACRAGEREYRAQQRRRRRQKATGGSVSASEFADGARGVRDVARVAERRTADPGEVAA